MPIYKLVFDRTVIERDSFIRYITAEDDVEARRIADKMAFDADLECPDDAESDGTSDCEGWQAIVAGVVEEGDAA